MAKINLVETLTRKYGDQLGENATTKVRAVLDYSRLPDTQFKTGLIGDIVIEGEDVLKALTEIAESSAFNTFTYSLAAARLSGVDESPQVAKMVSKLERAIEALRRPNVVKMMQNDLREIGPKGIAGRDFAIPYFDDLD